MCWNIDLTLSVSGCVAGSELCLESSQLELYILGIISAPLKIGFLFRLLFINHTRRR
ncbi:hypothetical protein BVRB_4g093740 [Beta vulgaris subsp. vulgaris]|nr:hypothetical protein BVRB_4g093740 [Beta vulgaris subsp. vulgaris]